MGGSRTAYSGEFEVRTFLDIVEVYCITNIF
jgi:hypothetical protein